MDVQPSIEIYHALKMFEAEAKEAKVQMGDLIVEQGYHDNAVSWVLFDPTRVVQVEDLSLRKSFIANQSSLDFYQYAAVGIM